jgi:uncharacterized phage protein gp47/JayE
MTTSVPPVTFTPTGLVVPSEAAVLAGVQADINAAFGGNLNPALNTPQGQLASSLAAIIANQCNALFAQFVNQVDPDTASGFMQDAIARIYFLTRNPGVPSAAQCLCVGLSGVEIPLGALAADVSGNLWVCQQAGTIGISGNITLPFACAVVGPTACPANSISTIYQAIPGWDSITNPTEGVAGADVETQQEFAFRRQETVAANAHGSLPAIYGAVFEVPDVIDVYAIENTTSATVNTGVTNYPVAGHSIYVAVVGGAAQAIANAIWTKKDVGAGYNGNTTETVTDPSGYSNPVPSYAVSFEIPTAVPILYAVVLVDSPDLPANIIQLVQTAIVNWFTGATQGSTRARIGSLILAATYYAPVLAIGPEVSVLSILLGSVSATLTNQQMGIDQAPTIIPSNVSVTFA